MKTNPLDNIQKRAEDNYFDRVYRKPKSLLIKYRDGRVVARTLKGNQYIVKGDFVSIESEVLEISDFDPDYIGINLTRSETGKGFTIDLVKKKRFHSFQFPYALFGPISSIIDNDDEGLVRKIKKIEQEQKIWLNWFELCGGKI